MRRTWLSVALLLAPMTLPAVSLAQAPSLVVPATSLARENANIQMTLALLGALNARQFERLNTIMAPSFMYTDPALPAAVPTAGFSQFLQGFNASFPDLRYNVQRVVPHGNTVVVFFTADGTFTTDFPYAPGKVATANNKALSLPFVSVYDFKDGRIIHGQSYWDVATFLRFVGAMP